MSDRDALLAAIRANPDEDTPRLAYADWLEEFGPAEVACPSCNGSPARPPHAHCLTCRGTGSVPSPERAHAELIRAQCEITRLGPLVAEHNDCGPCGYCGGYTIAKNREAELLAARGVVWRKGPVCERCSGQGGARVGVTKQDGVTVRSMRVSTCPDCAGTGDAGGLLREMAYQGLPLHPVRIHWSRGFIERIEVPRLADLIQPDHTSGVTTHAHYAPTTLLRQLLADTPFRCVREVVPLDREPIPVVQDTQCRWWAEDSATVQRDLSEPKLYTVPRVLLELITGHVNKFGRDDRQFSTRAAAVSALGRAVVRFGSN